MNIIIVDDELSLSRILSEFLPKAIPGSVVTTKDDAIEAATLLQTLAAGDKAEWPDVIISDFHVGSLTGDMVLSLGAKLFLDAKLILMSGAANAQNIENARAKIERPFTFLQKPFSFPDLAEVIRG